MMLVEGVALDEGAVAVIDGDALIQLVDHTGHFAQLFQRKRRADEVAQVLIPGQVRQEKFAMGRPRAQARFRDPVTALVLGEDRWIACPTTAVCDNRVDEPLGVVVVDVECRRQARGDHVLFVCITTTRKTVSTRSTRERIDVALELGDELHRGKIVVSPKVREREAEATPAPLDTTPDFPTARVEPAVRRLRDPRHTNARHAVNQRTKRQLAYDVWSKRLAACAQVTELKIIKVERELDTHIRKRADFIERVHRAECPKVDAGFFEAAQRRKRKVLRVELVRGSKQFGLAPHDALLANAQPKPAVH